MKIALIGASGNIGSRILQEALARGHEVTAVARHAEKIQPQSHPHLTLVARDVAEGFADIARGHDVVVTSLRFSSFDPEKMLAELKASGVARYIAVGGAGGLEAEPGRRVIDMASFPDAWRGEAEKGIAWYKRLSAEKDLQWSFFSPAAMIEPGIRTGRFRLGTDRLIVDDDGISHISTEDYALALVDEIENPWHTQRRFTIGY